MASAFFLALVVKLGAVWARGLPPGRRTAEGGLVETVIQGVNSRTELASPPVCTGLESCAFHARPVHAALENQKKAEFLPKLLFLINMSDYKNPLIQKRGTYQ